MNAPPPSENQRREVREFLQFAQGMFLGAANEFSTIPNKFQNYNESRDINQVAARIFTKIQLIQKYIGTYDDLFGETQTNHRPKITFFDALDFLESIINKFVDNPVTVDVMNQLIFDSLTDRASIPSLLHNLRMLLKDHDELRERFYEFMEGDARAGTSPPVRKPVTIRSRL